MKTHYLRIDAPFFLKKDIVRGREPDSQRYFFIPFGNKVQKRIAFGQKLRRTAGVGADRLNPTARTPVQGNWRSRGRAPTNLDAGVGARGVAHIQIFARGGAHSLRRGVGAGLQTFNSSHCVIIEFIRKTHPPTQRKDNLQAVKWIQDLSIFLSRNKISIFAGLPHHTRAKSSLVADCEADCDVATNTPEPQERGSKNIYICARAHPARATSPSLLPLLSHPPPPHTMHRRARG